MSDVTVARRLLDFGARMGQGQRADEQLGGSSGDPQYTGTGGCRVSRRRGRNGKNIRRAWRPRIVPTLPTGLSGSSNRAARKTFRQSG